MKPSMRTKLEQLAKRLDEIDVHLSGEHAARDMNRFRSLGQERAEIEPVVSRFHDYKRAEADLQGAQQMLSEPEMKALAEEEIDASKAPHRSARRRAARVAAAEGPERRPQHFSGDSRRHRRRRIGTVRRRPVAHVPALCRASPLDQRDDFRKRIRHGRLQGSHRAAGRRGRLLEAEVRIGRSSSAARSGDRGTGPHPHVGVHGRRAARGRRDR